MGTPHTDSMDELKLLDAIAVASREAGEAILEIVRRGFDVETKRDASPVTEADHAAELIILGALARAAPGVPVIAEEEVAAGRIPDHGDTYFLVDPLDGTKEFVRGGDDYTVNIGLTPAVCAGGVCSHRRAALNGGLGGMARGWTMTASGGRSRLGGPAPSSLLSVQVALTRHRRHLDEAAAVTASRGSAVAQI